VLCSDNFHWPTVSEFLCDEHGSATIEFVIWVPLYVVLLVAVTDASILYLSHTEMWNAARDTARRISVGALTAADAPDRAGEMLLLSGRSYTVAASDAGPVIVEISVGVGDASIFGFFGPVLGRRLVARVQIMKEHEPPTL